MAKQMTTDNYELNDEGELLEKKQKDQKYIAPKIMQVLNTNDKKDKKTIREQERKNRQLLSNKFVQRLGEEYGDN